MKNIQFCPDQHLLLVEWIVKTLIVQLVLLHRECVPSEFSSVIRGKNIIVIVAGIIAAAVVAVVIVVVITIIFIVFTPAFFKAFSFV